LIFLGYGRFSGRKKQGITIDVAHIYFSTAKSYIIADTPGHVEYTRNMVTELRPLQVNHFN
jgi:sulfate adenylyltransferase subunit 1